MVKLEATNADGSSTKMLRHVHCGSGYASQNDTRLFFGLGDRQNVDKITVRWPSGAQQEFIGCRGDTIDITE